MYCSTEIDIRVIENTIQIIQFYIILITDQSCLSIIYKNISGVLLMCFLLFAHFAMLFS